jgi:hypothetical protein
MSTETRYTVVDASGDETSPVIIPVPDPIPEGPTGLTGMEDYSGGYTGYTGYFDNTGPTGANDQYAECIMISYEVCIRNGYGTTGQGYTGCIYHKK